MEFSFDATGEYITSIEEVRNILQLAASTTDQNQLVSGLTKAALVLLSGKFESFAESIADEYVYEASQACRQASEIPLALRVHHSVKLLGDIGSFKHHQRHAAAEEVFVELAQLWTDGGRPPKLNVDCKFSYGKHGEEELRRLFRTVGLNDVFDIVNVQPSAETMLESSEGRRMDFKGVFNSLTNLRNNILHQDASPNLTPFQVLETADLTKRFAVGLDRTLFELLPRCRSSSPV